MKLILALVISFVGWCAFGQPEDLNARDPRLNEGSLFTIQFSPGDKKISVALAGKPGVELSAGKIIVLGREISTSTKTRRLEIRPSGSQFEIVDPLPKGKAVEIEVMDVKDKDKKETFRIDLP